GTCWLFLRRVAWRGLFRRAAEAFLLNPADHPRGTIFDADISRLGRTEKHHRLAVNKCHIRKVERLRLRFGILAGEQPFYFRKVLFSQLATQAHPERFFFFTGWCDL